MAELDKLVTLARKVKMSPAQQEAQRRSFAYGNAGFENARVTRAMVDKQAEELEKNRK